MTASTENGAGWSCTQPPTQFLNCSRSDSLATGSSYPSLNVTVSIGNSLSTVTNIAGVTGGGDGVFHNASDLTNVNTPTLTVTKSHTADFTVGQTGTYTIKVGNIGKVATAGGVGVTDFLPFGMIATAVGGTGWNCSPVPTSFLNCTRFDSLATGSTYPPLTVIVNVGNSPATVTNSVSVTGGGDGLAHFASDITNVNAPVLAITKSHVGDFTAGQSGTYTIKVSNTGKIGTAGLVSVTDFLPQGLTATAVSGTGWSCSQVPTTFMTCTRSDSLATANS